MIVSASRRTDVPALYPEWLLGRLAAGTAEVANPFNPSQVRQVDLRPTPGGTMQALVLWTRDVRPGQAQALGLRHLHAPEPVRSRRQIELFDLSDDPYERADLAADASHAERIRRMTAELEGWWRGTGGAPLPR